jgi:pimeloyl-ACP methyl ester carboxylesterase
LAVPLDYDNPDGAMIKLALFRIPAKDPNRRIGVLLFNPGGPGESGVDFLRTAKDVVSDRLAARFDLVSWDPRGTGGSDPVRCGTGFGRALDAPLPLPTTTPERQAQDAVARRADQACQQTAGAILGHVGTANTARDLDRIRAALGAARISYIGYSYGTYLGQVYAQMFPGRVRAMVLDGVSDADLSPEQMLLAEAKGIEQSLNAFFSYCGDDARCPFHEGGHPAQAFDKLVARINAAPIRVGNRLLGESQFWGGVLDPLYTDQKDALARSLASAGASNGRPLLDAYDQLNDRRANGSYGDVGQAELAINCDDGLSVGQPATVTRLEPVFRAAAPRAGMFVLYGDLGCVYWPEKPSPPSRPIRAQGAPPIVVIGTTGDPVTPYQNAVAVAHQLASGVLLTNQGSGHTAAAGISGPCDPLVVPYLITGKAPRDGAICPGADTTP